MTVADRSVSQSHAQRSDAGSAHGGAPAREENPLRDLPYLRYGIPTGLVGAAVVAVFFLVVDLVAGQPLATPSALGATLFRGEPTEILNLGVGNYNTVQEVNLFIDKGLKYRPDQVVLFYFINDAEPVPQRSRFPGLGRYRIVTFYWSRLKALRARFADTPSFEQYYSALYEEGAPGFERSREALLQLRDLCDRHDIDLRVVLLPELHRLDPYAFAEEHALLMRFLEAAGIPAIDLAPAFRDQPDPQALWVARDDAHPNARAHALIAEYTLPFLSETP